jgi:hypothetical protein
MQKIMNFLSGKKTYIIATAAAALAFAQAMGWAIPEWTYVILGALGLGTLRAAVNKAE